MKTLLKLIAAACLCIVPAFAQNQLVGNLTVTTKEIVGTTGTAASKLHVVDTGTETPRGIIDDQYNTGTNSAQFNTRKARGTFAAPATIVTGDILGRFLAWGHDGSNFIESGNLRFTSSGTIAATRVPSQFEVYTSTNALPSVLTLALTINSAQAATLAGNLTLGTGGAILSGTTGSQGFTATGTNQSITLTPSGTGAVSIGAGTAANPALNFGDTSTGLYRSGSNHFAVTLSGGEVFRFQGTSFIGNSSATGASLIKADASTTQVMFGFNGESTGMGRTAANQIGFFTANAVKVTVAATTGNLLLGGLTTDDTVNTLQGAAGIIGGASNMTITSGTGASRTLTFKTTTSGGTATTALAINATQDATFSGSIQTSAGQSINSNTFNVLSAGTTASFGASGTANPKYTFVGSTDTQTSGSIVAWSLTPTYNQASGTAANTDLLINRTQTAVGSGAQLLLDAQVGGTSKASIDNNGLVKSGGFARVTGDVTNATATMSNLTNLSVTVASGTKYTGTVQVFGVDSVGADGLAFDLGGGSCTFTDIEFGFAAQPTGSTLGTVTSTTATTAVTLTVVSTSDAVYTLSFGFTCNAGGTFIPRFAQNSHSTGTATVRKNSGILLHVSTN